jgi:hypothetical protein
MSRRSNHWNNAVAASSFSGLKNECIRERVNRARDRLARMFLTTRSSTIEPAAISHLSLEAFEQSLL